MMVRQLWAHRIFVNEGDSNTSQRYLYIEIINYKAFWIYFNTKQTDRYEIRDIDSLSSFPGNVFFKTQNICRKQIHVHEKGQ